MNRKLTPEENQAEYAYWAAWLEKKREAAKVSTSGMQALRLELPKPPGGQDE